MELQIASVFFIALAILFPFGVYLTLRSLTETTDVRRQLSELQLLLERTTQLNDDLVAQATQAGRPVVMGPRERQYKDLGEF